MKTYNWLQSDDLLTCSVEICFASTPTSRLSIHLRIRASDPCRAKFSQPQRPLLQNRNPGFIVAMVLKKNPSQTFGLFPFFHSFGNTLKKTTSRFGVSFGNIWKHDQFKFAHGIHSSEILVRKIPTSVLVWRTARLSKLGFESEMSDNW